MGSVEDALTVKNYFSTKNLVILGNTVELKFSRYTKLVKPEDPSSPQCVLLVSIICHDNSSLPLQQFYFVRVWSVCDVDLQSLWHRGAHPHVHSPSGAAGTGAVHQPLRLHPRQERAGEDDLHDERSALFV